MPIRGLQALQPLLHRLAAGSRLIEHERNFLLFWYRVPYKVQCTLKGAEVQVPVPANSRGRVAAGYRIYLIWRGANYEMTQQVTA